MATPSRATRYEVWSRDDNGEVEKHGAAFGLTFEDACKHLASESIDFWTHFDKGRYRGRPLFHDREQALAASPPASK
ncbi:MAG: hypothetical protein OEZ06_29155 [Myxococcales bacterium]|nr:hypothetical protein [Myxococcales bacterium]